jgi:hypothetical protein
MIAGFKYFKLDLSVFIGVYLRLSAVNKVFKHVAEANN